ncbi:MAG: hypothetical protein ABIH18_09990 [Candidatus Omnitrophota bacterium]
MINIIFTNLIVLLNVSLLLKYFFPFENVIDYSLAFFLFYFAQIALSLELLGIFNILYLQNAIILNLAVLAVVFIVIKLLKLKPVFKFKAGIRQAVNNLNLNKTQIFCAAVIIGFFIVKVIINLANPPFGWDNLNYHFTYPVEWLKYGNLNMPISVSCDAGVSYYPINGSLFFLWFILPLKNVFLADLGQIPFFIAAFFAVYSISRKLKLSKEYAFFSAAIFTLIPNYFKQLKLAYVDIMVAALFLIALNFLFLLYKERTVKNTIFYSLAVGLMLGTKTTAMPLLIILFLPFFGAFLEKRKQNNFISLFFLSMLVIILTGGFSYIRNFIQTGNPLYPLNMKIFNITIFKGVVDNAVYRTAIRPGDFSLAKILFSEGLGAQTIIFFIPAIFLGLPLLLWKRKNDLNPYLVYFFILPFLFILIFRFILPLANLRYIYAAFAVSAVIAFYAADVLKIPKTVLKILVIVCTLASIGELGKRSELINSLILSGALFFILPYVLNFIKTKKLIKTIFIGSAAIFLMLVLLEKYYIKNEHRRYAVMVKYSGFWPEAAKAWDWLNINTTENNIAYIGRPVPFPLYGTNFKNNVYYVSVNKTEPAMLHYFPDSKYICGYEGNLAYRNFEDKNNYRGNADFSVWLENLRRKNTDYLFVYSEINTKTQEPFPIENQWAASHPEIFELVFQNNTIHIYKIKK